MEIYASSNQLLSSTSTDTKILIVLETMDLPQNLVNEDNNNDANEFDQYRQRSTQAYTLEQRLAVFDGEWIVRSTLLRDISPDIRTFESKGIIISPIPNLNSIEQIIDITRQVTLVLQLRVTWRELSSEWLTSENALLLSMLVYMFRFGTK